MARRKNNPLKRKPATREYRKVCWVSAEGATERDYFGMHVFKSADVSVKFPQQIHPGRTSPAQVRKRFEKALRTNDFRKDDEAWLVVDIDEWCESELSSLLEWEAADPRHHLAVSNPKFELFLVMHFEKGNGCTTSKAVDSVVKRHMPGYDKRLKQHAFTEDQVRTAIVHAKAKRRSCIEALPAPGMTDTYKLAERLLSSECG